MEVCGAHFSGLLFVCGDDSTDLSVTLLLLPPPPYGWLGPLGCGVMFGISSNLRIPKYTYFRFSSEVGIEMPNRRREVSEVELFAGSGERPPDVPPVVSNDFLPFSLVFSSRVGVHLCIWLDHCLLDPVCFEREDRSG